MGYKTMAMVGIRAEGSKLLDVAEKVSKLDEVIYLVVTSGRFDIFAEVVCRDHEDLLRFFTEKLSTIDGVRESELFMHLKILKESVLLAASSEARKLDSATRAFIAPGFVTLTRTCGL